MQKYRADYAETQSDGAICHFAKWLGGPTLAKIQNCRIYGAEFRLCVYITGEADTYFSIPAATRKRGKYVRGYITTDSAGYIFHAMDSHKHLVAPFKSIAAIKAAVDAGKPVKWSNNGYDVIRDSLGQYLIVFRPNGYTIGLTNRAGDNLNGALSEFYIGESV